MKNFKKSRSQSSMQLDELKTEADEKMIRSISVDDSLNKLVDDEDVEVWLLQKPKSISLKALSNGFDPKRTTSFTTDGMAYECVKSREPVSCKLIPFPQEGSSCEAKELVHQVKGFISFVPVISASDTRLPQNTVSPPALPDGLQQRFQPFGCFKRKSKKESVKNEDSTSCHLLEDDQLQQLHRPPKSKMHKTHL
ncbi:Di/tripeptide-binding protein [Trichinella spiralis]|uniref:Di/tripeptide-binding protein n=1 Tax=Trichinella spiralis TaxID=6334 RepID=A0ABR3L285_TRISP